MFTMPDYCHISFAVFLVLSSFNKQVFAECSDSLICGDKTNEILLIAAVIAVCVIFFLQSIVIACIAHKFRELQKRMERLRLSRGTYTYHATYPDLSPKERMIEQTEDVTYMPSHGERHYSTTFHESKRNSTVHEFTIIDNPDANDNKEIWIVASFNDQFIGKFRTYTNVTRGQMNVYRLMMSRIYRPRLLSWTNSNNNTSNLY